MVDPRRSARPALPAICLILPRRSAARDGEGGPSTRISSAVAIACRATTNRAAPAADAKPQPDADPFLKWRLHSIRQPQHLFGVLVRKALRVRDRFISQRTLVHIQAGAQ